MTRHRLDLFSLLSGLVLTAIAVVALTGIDLEVARWLGPAVLIGVGVLVLAAVVSRERGPADAEDEVPPPHDDATLAEARAEVDAADLTADHTTDHPSDHTREV